VLVAQSDEREELSVMSEVEGRLVVNAHTTPFLPYDLEGPVQPEMTWLPVSFDAATGQGCYLMRMEPGAITIAHDHPGMEEFLVLEGDLVDSDGTVFTAGDFVSYEAGTHHNSWTKKGCLLAVFEWRRPWTTRSGDTS
jgi:anti-sigma factor ChrR (cupin superfamily)